MSSKVVFRFAGLALVCGVINGVANAENGATQVTQPDWIVPVLDAGFDASYQDTRSQNYIHEEIARALADSQYVLVCGSPDDESRKPFCVSSDGIVSPEMQEALNNLHRREFHDRFALIEGEWLVPTANTPRAVTWSIVPDGLLITDEDFGTGVSGLFGAMGAQFAEEGGIDVFIQQIQAAFDRWSAISGLSYTYLHAPGVSWDDGAAWGTAGNGTTRGEVRISMRVIDGSSGVLAFNRFPPDGSDMVMDIDERWDDNNPPTFRLLRNVVMHEHGHGMGLHHTCPVVGVNLMEPLATDAFDGAQEDDLRAVQYVYGDLYEPNGTSATATNIGSVTPGVTVTTSSLPGLSIPNGSASAISESSTPVVRDTDWFRIDCPAPVMVNITAAPMGSTYTSGACGNEEGVTPNDPVTVNARVQANLAFEAFASNGTTSLVQRNATPIGSNETFLGLLLAQGTNFVKVTNGTPVVELPARVTQAYNLSVVGQVRNLRINASDNLQNRIELTWSFFSNAAQYRIRRNTTNNAATSQVIETIDDPGTLSFDDESAVPLTQYYYWLEVQQSMNNQWIRTTLATDGEPGMRAPDNVPPTANAGPDFTVFDTPGAGFGQENVTLNGSASNDPDGTVAAYFWLRNNLVILQGQTGQVTLPIGVHTITLIVVDNQNAQSQPDTVIVTVNQRACDSIDFNNDSSRFDPQDIEAFLSVYSEGPCVPAAATCNDIDFNNDGAMFDPQDISAFLSVYSEGPCF